MIVVFVAILGTLPNDLAGSIVFVLLIGVLLKLPWLFIALLGFNITRRLREMKHGLYGNDH